MRNPDWRVQLAKVELVRAKSGLPAANSEPNLHAQLGFREGKENTRESGFVQNSIPHWQSGALFDWEIDLWGKWKLLEESSFMHIQEAEYLKEGKNNFHSRNSQFLGVNLCPKRGNADFGRGHC